MADIVSAVALSDGAAAIAGQQLFSKGQVVVALDIGQRPRLVNYYSWRAQMIRDQPVDLRAAAAAGNYDVRSSLLKL